MKQPCLLSQVYLMISSIKLSGYLYEIVTGENRVGSERKRSEREREREWQISSVRAEHWSEVEIAWVGKGC